MFQNVIIPIDLSDQVRWEEMMTKTLNIINPDSAMLHLLYIFPEVGMNILNDYMPQKWFQNKKKGAEAEIEKFIKRFIPREIQVKIYIAKGIVSSQVLSYAEEVEADLIVLTAFKNYQDNGLGPNAKKIIKNSKISVLLLRNEK